MTEAIPSRTLEAIIARLEAADYGIVMVAPGYSRAELIADLRAILVESGSGRCKDDPIDGKQSGP